MILKALYDYYHRCEGLAPAGMEYKEIAFLIVIDTEGNFIRLEDNRIDKKSGNKHLVVKGVRSGTALKPYIFWDNVEYLCNYTKLHPEPETELTEKEAQARNKAIQKALEKHQALVKMYQSIAKEHPDNIALKAVCRFYQKGEIEKVYSSPLWKVIAQKPTVNMSFRIQGETHIVAEEPCLIPQPEMDQVIGKNDNQSVCLITGKKSTVVESTSPTPIFGGQATARLVSFQVHSGYDSYGKSKGFNASISKEAEACYTTALNKLLTKGSRNMFRISNRTFVFWASSRSEAAENTEKGIFTLFRTNKDPEDKDDPNRRIESVRQIFNNIYSGKNNSESNDSFYILGLAPNSARESVVYWNETPLKDFAKKILKHFEDMSIVESGKERKSFTGIYPLLSAVSLGGDLSKIQPNLTEMIIKSILQGLPYPYTLMMACIGRIRAEQKVTTTRAAIIKGYLNRLNDNNNSKITNMIDLENTNQGYLCGRLFATLEYAQEKGNGNSNIRERYMNAASATPAAVFPTLLNLSVHHVEKMEMGGQIFLEKTKAGIIDKISSEGFPPHLDLADQGRFMVGYYHQRQKFYETKTENKNNK